MDRLVPIGYFPKGTTVPKGWHDSDTVKEICSVSDCLSSIPENWTEFWLHNDFGYFNSEQDALKVCGGLSNTFHLFAFRLLSTVFSVGEPSPYSIPEFPVEPIPEHYLKLGYDVANAMPEFNVVPFLNCSPLSCNGFAKEIPVNQFCLLDSVEQAIDLAKRFSVGGAEPGPYFVLEVLRSGRPNPALNSDPAATVS